MTIILKMMTTEDARKSIPVHQSTVRALRGVKSADQNRDGFLMALADGYIPPTLKRKLDHQLRSEEIVSGAEMKREYSDWRRRGAGVPGR